MTGDRAVRDDEKLAREAADCDDCLQWLKHCHAECCNHFGFYLPPGFEEPATGDIRLYLKLSPDAKRYYELHGVRVMGDVLVLPPERCVFLSDRIWVTMPCSALTEDFRCGLHNSGKPKLCADLTLETARDPGYRLTPKCLYRYKRRAVADASTP